ncbi:MAG: LacI family DNA-binding transcriptional regulator [Gemmiger sp.]
MTIYDIAKLAGVSASSVSRVVNGKPGVNKETRRKIEELLRQHNYIPDANARNLVTQSNHTIGILTDDINTLHQVEGCQKVEYELMRNGYYCFVKYIGSGEDAVENGMIDLARHRVEGALCLGNAFRSADIVNRAVPRHLPNTPIIMVHNNSTFEPYNVYSVGADECSALERCVTLMAGKGRRNLALVINDGRVSAPIIREGFEHGLRLCPEIKGVVYTGVPATVEGGEQIALRLLKEHPEVDGLICAHDLIAIGALNELQDQGIRVPERMSILGENNSAFCETCRPKLSSLDPMISMAAIMGARTLLDVLEKREPSRRITLQMEIVERGST